MVFRVRRDPREYRGRLLDYSNISRKLAAVGNHVIPVPLVKLSENNQLRPVGSALRWFADVYALERNETTLLIIGNPISSVYYSQARRLNDIN